MGLKWDIENREGLIILDSSMSEKLDLVRYHSSWNWLMSVIDKIQETFETEETYGVLIDICTTHVRISVVEKGFETTIDFKLENSISKIEAVYKAVINFINWYNKNNCKYVKKEGESCTLNNNCTYPNCETLNKN